MHLASWIIEKCQRKPAWISRNPLGLLDGQVPKQDVASQDLAKARLRPRLGVRHGMATEQLGADQGHKLIYYSDFIMTISIGPAINAEIN